MIVSSASNPVSHHPVQTLNEPCGRDVTADQFSVAKQNGWRSLDRHRQTELVLLGHGIGTAIGWYRSAQFYIGTGEKTTKLNWDSSTCRENDSGLYIEELSSAVSIAMGNPAVCPLC